MGFAVIHKQKQTYLFNTPNMRTIFQAPSTLFRFIIHTKQPPEGGCQMNARRSAGIILYYCLSSTSGTLVVMISSTSNEMISSSGTMYLSV